MFGRWLRIMHDHCINHAVEVAATDWQIVHEVAIAVADLLDGRTNVMGLMQRDIVFPVLGARGQPMLA
jgi:hypothetical protein